MFSSSPRTGTFRPNLRVSPLPHPHLPFHFEKNPNNARNLPNIPLPDDADLLDGQTSSTYFNSNDVSNLVPLFVSTSLLDLHFVCLLQARTFNLLSKSGVLLSSMGGRVPIETMLRLSEAAGFTGRILSMSWKVQSEPDEVIGGYAKAQERGLGPVSYPLYKHIIRMI